VAYLEKATGISINTVVTRALLASDAGWKLLKAQSRWEAGKPIPMTDANGSRRRRWYSVERRRLSCLRLR